MSKHKAKSDRAMKRTPLNDDEPRSRVNGRANGHAYINGHANGHATHVKHPPAKHIVTDHEVRAEEAALGNAARQVPQRGGYEWLDRVLRERQEKRVGHTVWRDYFPEMAFQLRLLGATRRSIAAAFNTTEKTIQEWMTHKHEFRVAMQAGGDLADARVADSMYRRAVGYEHDEVKIMAVKQQHGTEIVHEPFRRYYPPDTTAGVFWLVNRQKGKWRNRVTNELTGPDGEKLAPPQVVIQPVRAATQEDTNKAE